MEYVSATGNVLCRRLHLPGVAICRVAGSATALLAWTIIRIAGTPVHVRSEVGPVPAPAAAPGDALVGLVDPEIASLDLLAVEGLYGLVDVHGGRYEAEATRLACVPVLDDDDLISLDTERCDVSLQLVVGDGKGEIPHKQSTHRYVSSRKNQTE